MNHRVNFNQDVNSAHVSIVIYLRLQGTSIQPFISSNPNFLCLVDRSFWAFSFLMKTTTTKKKEQEKMSAVISKYLSSSPLVNLFNP